MTLQIKKLSWREYTGKQVPLLDRKAFRHVTVYVILQDGIRIDSFLRHRNALAKVRHLRATTSP